ncbi:hypothetical protein [Allokutzneria albata]|uniref:Uncharacterized protein n=1 Tax=Allokutzneria albata TaxID=211114 RepID=A0A1G9Y032_ALLAB|nr:hypothetical protein [Allokutzneria albata]SDN02414.1 hypothetical protein SAMN04489726_4515 [Allokutzneria albata]
MSVQLVDAPTDVFSAAGDVEAELSVLATLDSGAAGDVTFTFPTAFSSFPSCCTLADF